MRATPYGFEFFESCVKCKWRSETFFCHLGGPALKTFDMLAFTNVYPQGAVLFAESQPVRGIFLICRGSAKLSISAGDGKTIITRIVGAGEVLGISSAFTGSPYKTTAETLEPTQVNFVRNDDFLKFVREFQDGCFKAAQQLSHECEAETDHIRALGLSHSASEKLANLLLSWSQLRGKETDGGTRIQLLMTHEDMSQLIGTSRETVTRILKEFRDQGLLTIRGSTLTILDKTALKGMVQL